MHTTITWGGSPAQHNEPPAYIHLTRQKADPLGRGGVGRSKCREKVTRRSDAMGEHDSKTCRPTERVGDRADSGLRGGSKPVTAVLMFLILPVRPCPPIGSVNPGGGAPFRMLRCLVSAVKQFHLPDPPPPPPPAEPNKKEVILAASRSLDEIVGQRFVAAGLCHHFHPCTRTVSQ
jgi:hypothetical protein